MSVSQLKKWNHLRSNNLRVGQVLVIYGKGGGPVSTAKSASSSAANSSVTSQQSVAKSGSATSSKQSAAAKSGLGSVSASGTSSSKSAGASGYAIYTVKKGDTLYSIAKAYPGISADDIMKFNGISTAIKPGMVLKIPKK